MAVTNSKGLEMEEKIKELEKRVDVLYAVLYWDHFRSVDNIITKRKKNRQLLTDELTTLAQFLDDKKFARLFYDLIKYTEVVAPDLADDIKRARESVGAEE